MAQVSKFMGRKANQYGLDVHATLDWVGYTQSGKRQYTKVYVFDGGFLCNFEALRADPEIIAQGWRRDETRRAGLWQCR